MAKKTEVLAYLLLTICIPSTTHALPSGFVDELVASGISDPTAMAFAPDGRLFVTEQTGAVRVVKGGVLQSAPFVRLAVDSEGERGLLGVAFHPNFTTNRFVYLYLTVPGAPPHNRVTRFTADGDVAVPGSATAILDLEDLSKTNHNGGAIHFGEDAKLYVAVGENGTPSNAQSLGNRLGKILRIHADGSIPADNPLSFPGITGETVLKNRAIWAVGLRNPFTFAIQPHTGAMMINEVGASTFEEVNSGGRGRNYGWPATEGPTSIDAFTGPIYAYRHPGGGGPPTGCAITGGAFYNPGQASFPAAFVGKYFFADYCGDWIYYLDPARPSTATLFHSGLSGPVDLAVGAGGALYYTQRGNGQLRRVRYSGDTAQAIVVPAARLEVGEGNRAVAVVRLARRPTANRDVRVDRYLSDPSVTVSPAAMRFTPSNWNTGQRLTVAVGQDQDATDDGATVRLTSPGVAPTSIRVVAVDNDRPAGSPRAVISQPQNGETMSGANAEFFGDGLSDGTVVRAVFLVDGVVRYNDANGSGADGSGHYHIGGAHRRWDTTRLRNGDHLLTMRVYDAQGRWGAHTIKVKVWN